MPLLTQIVEAVGASRRVHVILSGVKSRSHLVHIAALLHTVRAECPQVEQVRVTFHQQARFLNAPAVGADVVTDMLGDGVAVDGPDAVTWQFESDAARLYVSVGAPGIKPWMRLRRANPKRRFLTVVTDEGIGTYGTVAQRISAQRRQGLGRAQAYLKAGAISVARRVLTGVRWAGYLRTSQGWAVRPEFAAQLRTAIPHDGFTRSQDAVILTQPFVDMGLISQADHLAYVSALADAARAAGFRPRVRPHPAEDVSRYRGYDVVPGGGPVELDPQVAGAAVVMGGPSTGLVNLAGVFGTRVLWVSIPGLEHLDTAVSREQQEIFATFLGRRMAVADVPDALR